MKTQLTHQQALDLIAKMRAEVDAINRLVFADTVILGSAKYFMIREKCCDMMNEVDKCDLTVKE